MDLVFIGFGEAAFHIAKGLRSETKSDLNLSAYDANASDPILGAAIQQRAQDTQVTLLSSFETLCQSNANFFICLTSASSALAIAQQVLPQLRAGQVYVDMNSASPKVKQAIAKIECSSEVKFCDAAVMGTVPGNQHRVPMLLTGNGAQHFHDVMSQYGMKLTVLDAEVGSSSAVKMLKSVVMKGLPQLLIESLQAAETFGITDILMESLAESLEGKSIEKLANTFTARTLIHAKRRSAEMADSLKTLQEAGVNAQMTEATKHKLDLLAANDWRTLLGENGSELPYLDAIQILNKHTKGDM